MHMVGNLRGAGHLFLQMTATCKTDDRLGLKLPRVPDEGEKSLHMIHNVFVFNADGIPLLTVKIGSIEANSALLAGFLSAIQSFSEKVVQGSVEEISVSNHNFHIQRVGDLYVALVSDRSDADAKARLHDVCEIVESAHGKLDSLVRIIIRDAVLRKNGVRGSARNWAIEGL